MDEEKLFTGYILLNYRRGTMRIVKRLPRTLNTNTTEIPVSINIKVKIPQAQMLRADGEITLSGAQMAKIVMDEVRQEQ